jgi:tetratricopeptide (TPR) repeat protein
MRKAPAPLYASVLLLVCGLSLDPAAAARLGYSRADCLRGALSAQDVVSACTTALRGAKKPRDILFRRAVAFFELGEFDYAIGDFSRALRLKPDDVASLELRGLAFELKGDSQASLSDYQRALVLNPADPAIRLSIARAIDAVARADAEIVRRTEPPTIAASLAPPAFATPAQGAPRADAGELDPLFLALASALLLASAALMSLTRARR